MYRELNGKSLSTLTKHCPVCESKAIHDADVTMTIILIVCPICGKYRYNSMAHEFVKEQKLKPDSKAYRISYYLRTVADRGFGQRNNDFYPVYRLEDFERMIDTPDIPVIDKMNSLLRFIVQNSSFLGEQIPFDGSTDYSALNARNGKEATNYLAALVKRGLLQQVNPPAVSNPLVSVTVDGWAEVERIAQSGGESFSGFIAMWFDPSRAEFDKAIARAIESSGYLPVRIDRVEHTNRIDDEIIARIRQAKFMIADFTGQRNGVYFEAGFMLGLGRTVIWLCHKTQLDKVHFDTRQYNTIDYADATELERRLRIRIEALLGKGPHKPEPDSCPLPTPIR
jgi:hypothetical protein